MTDFETPVKIDVLANDDFSACIGLLFDTVTGSGAKYGAVVITDSDKTLLYTPNSDHFGIDSLDYEIECTDE